MGIYSYSEWDGTQDWAKADADDLLAELERNLMDHGDLSQALRMMQRFGIRGGGRQMPGLQELQQRLRRQRQQNLEK